MRGSSRIDVKEKPSATGLTSADENTVSLEDQIVKMTENTLMYNSLVQLVHKKFTMLKYAINEGRR
jgi:flagellar basal-body rod protein FlgB